MKCVNWVCVIHQERSTSECPCGCVTLDDCDEFRCTWSKKYL